MIPRGESPWRQNVDRVPDLSLENEEAHKDHPEFGLYIYRPRGGGSQNHATSIVLEFFLLGISLDPEI